MNEDSKNVANTSSDNEPLLFSNEELKPSPKPFYDIEDIREKRIAQKAKMGKRRAYREV